MTDSTYKPPPARTEGKCYCGELTTGYHSGQFECGKCWTNRKLDHPAASHWAPAAMHFLSNVDMYDKTQYFAKAGLTQDEWVTMLKAADKLLVYSDKILFDVALDDLPRDEWRTRRANYLAKNGF